MNKVKVLGKDKQTPYIVRTRLNGVIYDLNTLTGGVWFYQSMSDGSDIPMTVTDKQIKNDITSAVNNFINNSN